MEWPTGDCNFVEDKTTNQHETRLEFYSNVIDQKEAVQRKTCPAKFGRRKSIDNWLIDTKMSTDQLEISDLKSSS